MRSRLSRAVFALIALASGFWMVSCGNDSDESTPTPTVEATRAPSLQIIPFGRTAVSDEAEITILNVRTSDEENGERAPDGYDWRFLEFEVKNVGTEPWVLYASLVRAGGRVFERAHPPTATPELDEEIEPGEQVRGEIAFLVDKETPHGQLLYGPGEARWAFQLGMPRPGR